MTWTIYRISSDSRIRKVLELREKRWREGYGGQAEHVIAS